MNAQDHLNKAHEHEQAAAESFERCDTDGFLSQWAHGLHAQLELAKAEIAENDGKMPFRCLMETTDDGPRRVDAKLVNGQYGAVWLLSDSDTAHLGRRFVPFAGQGGKSRIQKQLGLFEDWEEAPAKARIAGRGTGLSGNAWVEIYRTDGR